MIQTQLLHPEVFVNILLDDGVEIKEIERKVKKRTGFFGTTEIVEVVDKKEIPLKKLDERLLSTFPQDVAELIREKPPSERGYSVPSCRITLYSSQRSFTRDFTYTLNEFYKKHNITQKNLISLEYCKNGCNVSGAYITWENGK